MSDAAVLPLSVEDYDAAFTEVSFLLDIFSAAVHELMGGATAPVGRVSGRRAARKLPVHLPEPTIDSVLTSLAGELKPGFGICHRLESGVPEVSFGHCAVRQICARRNAAPGGPLCVLFHQHMDGMINELLARPVKSSLVATGDSCLVRLEVR